MGTDTDTDTETDMVMDTDMDMDIDTDGYCHEHHILSEKEILSVGLL